MENLDPFSPSCSMVWFFLTFFFSLLLIVNCFHLSAPATATVGVPITVTWTREKPAEPVDFSLVSLKLDGTPNLGDSVLVQSNGAQSGTASITINDEGRIFLGAYNTTNLSDTDITSLAVLDVTLVQVSPASQNQGSKTQSSSSVSTSPTSVISTSPTVTSSSTTTSGGSKTVSSDLSSQSNSFTSTSTSTSTSNTSLVVGQATETSSSESQTTPTVPSDPSPSPNAPPPNEPVHGLSSSQKAGIAAGGGALFLLLILAGLLLCYRRRRQRSRLRLSSLADIDPYDSCASSSLRTQSLPLQSDTLPRGSMMTVSVDPQHVFYKESLITSLRPVSNSGQEMVSPVGSGMSRTRTRELSTLSYASNASPSPMVPRDYDRKSRFREEDLGSEAPPPLYSSRPPSGYLGSRTV